MYYHYIKRTAEKHVTEHHPGQKIYVKDVRAEADQIKKTKQETKKKPSKEVSTAEIIKYQPYKCGLCDIAAETIEIIRNHCAQIHETSHQFKCSLCDFSSDNKSSVENHCEQNHSDSKVVMMRIFYVDPTSTSNLDTASSGLEERREPLWKRDMPGLKHIRGILYEEYPEEFEVTEVKNEVRKEVIEAKGDEVDNFPMKCKECGLQKKTIKGLKMHIKLLHLRTGKFLCRRCQFSANMMNSINTHYKIKHPEAAEAPDFEERGLDKLNFSHEFWKADWGIPTLAERKALVKEKRPLIEAGGKKRKASTAASTASKSKKMKKKGVKRKLSEAIEDPIEQPLKPQVIEEIPVLAQQPLTASEATTPVSEKPLSVMEISPFERVPTYKCQYCSKRSNILEKLETHLKVDHPNAAQDPGYKIMTRDQVVDMLTLNLASNAGDFICYFCDEVVGTIHDVKAHALAEHDKDFKVKQRTILLTLSISPILRRFCQ